ncbi:hypothetical protein ACQ0MK_18780 [Thalassospira lucentensis]|uniref:hypothetical protein n=1 Tax=Thalassospira lucentensis TaxID=168935 RepID=UPI003D2EF4A4
MYTMGNATGDLMANWISSGGVLLAQDVNAADDIDQELRAAASTQGASCGWIDPEIRNAAMSVSPPTCDLFLGADPEISAAQGSHQFKCTV